MYSTLVLRDTIFLEKTKKTPGANLAKKQRKLRTPAVDVFSAHFVTCTGPYILTSALIIIIGLTVRRAKIELSLHN